MVRCNASYLAEVNGQRWARMAARGLWLALFLMLGAALSGATAVAAIAASLPYLSGQHRSRALATDVAVSLATAIVVLIALRLA